MTSTTTATQAKQSKKPGFPWRTCLAAAFWVAVWQFAAMALDQKILLVSPLAVLQKLWELLPTWGFWRAILFSFSRITQGFLAACLAGILCAALASRFRLFRELISPLMTTIKSTPVASFIILLLLWVSSRNLSFVISFLMVLPIVFSNVLGGIASMDRDLGEMARVFRVPFPRRLRYLYLPQILPFFRSACGAGLGLCWKAGVAAEVIGLPNGSIGERLYSAKIYLNTAELFAWTLVIILISVMFEKLFLFLLDRGTKRLER